MLDARELWHGCTDPRESDGTKAGRSRSDDEENEMMTTRPTTLNAAQSDRAAGVLFGHACGDALGAGYEFGPPIPADVAVSMIGGGTFGWAPGEWTDDTQMAVPILEAAEKAVADGGELLDHLDDVAVAWAEWARHAADVGNQTRSVLSDFRAAGATTASALLECSRRHHERTGHTAGNGSLMRTSPVALAYLGDEDRIAAAARAVSNLTHYDDDAGDACVLWCLAINRAVLTGKLDVERGLRFIPEARRELWERRCFEAVCREPVEFDRNGWVVHAFQAAWSAIATTPVPTLASTGGSFPAHHFRLALENAVRAGNDTDTVAAIAGQLLGARWGISAVPVDWRRLVHGEPGLTGAELANRGLALARGGADSTGWPLADRIDYGGQALGRRVHHPHDDRVLLGDVAVLDDLPAGVDAIVSLCRVGRRTPAAVSPADHVTVWLVDSSGADVNPNLDFVLADAADAVAALRNEGRTVLLHCVAAQSRTPAVAAAYAVRHLGRDPHTALAEVCAALPDARPNPGFVAAVERMSPRVTA
jgi:ADP-ribosylglycohydrolase/predicted protein tyrosine phosphatase